MHLEQHPSECSGQKLGKAWVGDSCPRLARPECGYDVVRVEPVVENRFVLLDIWARLAERLVEEDPASWVVG